MLRESNVYSLVTGSFPLAGRVPVLRDSDSGTIGRTWTKTVTGRDGPWEGWGRSTDQRSLPFETAILERPGKVETVGVINLVVYL